MKRRYLHKMWQMRRALRIAYSRLTVRAIFLAILWISPTILPILAQDTASEAAKEVSAIVLFEDVTLDFIPTRGYFFVEAPNAPLRRAEAVLVPPYQQKERPAGEAPGQTQRWIAGVPLEPQGSQSLKYSVLVTGAAGRALFVPPKAVSPSDKRYFEGEQDAIRERLMERKGVLKSLEIQLKDQELMLERLRADADVIANLGRIVEVRDEIDHEEAMARNIDRDMENIQKFLKIIKSAPGPKNLAGRESQLTRQLAELAEAARTAEAGEIGRRARSEGELRERLGVIEASRSEDYDALQRELIKLRKERLSLEKGRAM